MGRRERKRGSMAEAVCQLRELPPTPPLLLLPQSDRPDGRFEPDTKSERGANGLLLLLPLGLAGSATAERLCRRMMMMMSSPG